MPAPQKSAAESARERDLEREKRVTYELKMLEGAWRGASEPARAEFMARIGLWPHPPNDDRVDGLNPRRLSAHDRS
jgi:hypothetical protein